MAFHALILIVLLFTVETLAVHFTWPALTFKTVPWRPPKLEIKRTDEPAAPGLLFIGPKSNLVDSILTIQGSTSLIYDPDGNLVWKGPDIETTNVQVKTLFGKPVLMYWNGVKVEGYGYGAIHILDETYKEIYTVTLHGDFQAPSGVPEGSCIDLHESQVTSRNTMLVTSYNVTQLDVSALGGPRDNWVLQSGFHEIDVQTNEVLFSWSVLDHLDRLPLTLSRRDDPKEVRGRKNPWDIHHINSVDEVADGYLISLRHSFSILYINRNGSIRWILDGETGGDFDLCESCRFSWQHHVRAYDETPESITLTIFNNDGREGGLKGLPTTGLVLHLDLNTMTVTNRRRLYDPRELLNSDTQGSLQAIGETSTGNMLMGYGSWAAIKEFNLAGNVVWSAKFGPDAQIGSYRSFKYDWHATPWYPPTLLSTAYKAPNAHTSTHFYVSWNGATEVASWNFYAQASEDTVPVLLKSVPKRDFETGLVVDGLLDYVSVEAVDRNGAVLGRTPMRRTELHGDWGLVGTARPAPDDPKVAAEIASSHPDPEQLDQGKAHGEEDNTRMGGVHNTDGPESQVPVGMGVPLMFLMFCSAGIIVLGLFWLSQRHRYNWYEWVPSKVV